MRKPVAFSLVLAGVVLVALPTRVAAQCAGGTTVAGYYLSNGSYVPSHCFDPYPTPLDLLYPSGAQWMPTVPPAAGAISGPGSPLRGQWIGLGAPEAGPDTVSTVGPGVPQTGPGPSPLLPPTSSAVPRYLATGQPGAAGPGAPGALPGTPGREASPTGMLTTPSASGPLDLVPHAGLQTSNRSLVGPSALAGPGDAAATTTVASPPMTASGMPAPSPVNPAYSFSLPTAPPRAGSTALPPAAPDAQAESLAAEQAGAPSVIAYPNR
jgi:hypothetical protein